MRRFTVLPAACLLLTAGASGAGATEAVIQKDIVYARPGGVELRLDLARPPRGDGPFPLVICLHGGAWQLGHRSRHHETIRHLARHGYVAATAQYRLTPKHRFPAQIEDAQAAVRFLRANARKYAIDPARVAALGDSAGGHLALLLGLRDGPDKVQAVVNYYGPTDLRTWASTPLGQRMLRAATGKDGNGLLRDLLGTADRKAPTMKKASPVTFIDPKDPPVLTFHGTLDPLVPLSQAELLHAALRRAGVPERLEILKNASHGWGGQLKERTDRITVAFLDRHLKERK